MWIDSLDSNEVFVYGANEAGRHGAGAAKQAMQWGAKYGEYGLNGHTYGIPTKDRDLQVLPLIDIYAHVVDFLSCARRNPRFTFLVTEIGCGLAGYKVDDIAPMFAVIPDNVVLNESFRNFLNKQHE